MGRRQASTAQFRGSRAGYSLLRQALGYWDARYYPGSGNWANLGTLGSTGARNITPTAFTDGEVMAVAYWDRALSADELAAVCGALGVPA